MTATRCIRNLDWAIVWDEERRRHCYLNHADVVFRGDRILHVGPDFIGPVDEIVDGSGLLAMPGLINLHSHAFSMVMEKGSVEDPVGGRRGELQWYNNIKTFTPPPEYWPICTEVGYSELLKSGVTTLVDVCLPGPDIFEVAHRSGMRIYLAPMYTSTAQNSMWQVHDEREVVYPWAEDNGMALMRDTLSALDRATGNNKNELVKSMPMPAQLETCTAELLQASLTAARERAVPMQVHVAQNAYEFQEITRRHGTTPIKFMHDIGILCPDVMIAHGIMLDHHSDCREWGTRDDLRILADSGTTVVHCPTYYARYFARVLEHFGAYRDAGVNLGIGTDTYPHNLIEEMRLAILCSRVVSGDTASATTADMLNAVTVNGAWALMRSDLGRLAPGAKADIVLVDLKHPLMQPARDPLRSLIYAAAERAVRDVYVNGTKVLEQGEVLTLDYARAVSRLEEVRQRTEENIPKADCKRRTSEEIAPLSLPKAK